MKLEIAARAIKELRRTGQNASKIRQNIKQYASDPKNLSNNMKVLQGCGEYRLLVGDCRVLFVIENDVMTVTNVRKRDEAYDD